MCSSDLLSIDAIVDRMSEFGQVIDHRRGYHRRLPSVFNGVLHLSMCLEDPANLPAFLQMPDFVGRLIVSMAVHSDHHRRVCYKCGGDHVGTWCRASNRQPGASPSLWCDFPLLPAFVAPIAASGPPAAPPPAASTSAGDEPAGPSGQGGSQVPLPP